jgi:hypothetical protein
MLTEKDLFFQTAEYQKRMPYRQEDRARIAGELLLAFGITPHLVGFEPLREGVRITAERERGSERPPIRDLEPAVERLCGEHSPEHAMRDAIGAGFLGPDEIHTRVFPFSDRPSCAEFICTLAELVLDRITQI